MVAGPPVEVQVRVLDWPSKVKLVTLGEPASKGLDVNKMELACVQDTANQTIIFSYLYGPISNSLLGVHTHLCWSLYLNLFFICECG